MVDEVVIKREMGIFFAEKSHPFSDGSDIKDQNVLLFLRRILTMCKVVMPAWHCNITCVPGHTIVCLGTHNRGLRH